MIDLIEKTRQQIQLTQLEIRRLISGIVSNEYPDYQISAWLMAVCCRGLQDEEVFWLTDAMARSGDLETQPLGVVDKHSTGGVGDKTTLIVAPIVASLGIPIAKMSGRGLGHTGGTLDKLESIPGFNVTLSRAEITSQVNKIGIAVVAQSSDLAPADKKLYALRDVTGTVKSIPLIASSIMSKKLAGGAPNLVLDVKVGNGAFMESLTEARQLAELMVKIGLYHGIKVKALLTNMSQPLGYAIGNAIEINEARQCLLGTGARDLREESIALASQMLSTVRGISDEEALFAVTKAMDTGSAWNTFVAWIGAQGGDVALLQTDLPLAPYQEDWFSAADEQVSTIDTHRIGQTALELGAGRHKLGDMVQHDVGILCYAKVGKQFNKGEIIATVYAKTADDAHRAVIQLQHAIHFGNTEIGQVRTILDIVSSDN